MSTISTVRIPIQQQEVNLIDVARRSQSHIAPPTEKQTGFKEMFSQELASEQNVSFSRHARLRLYSRGVELSDQKLTDLSQAITKAESKGSKETLVLSDNAAFVVSVPNRTVITVFDRNNLREGVVTSIDSAVIM
jgi:flagellar operon protein